MRLVKSQAMTDKNNDDARSLKRAELLPVPNNATATVYNEAIKVVPKPRLANEVDAVDQLSRKAQDCLTAKIEVVKRVLEMEVQGIDPSVAVENILARAKAKQLDTVLQRNLLAALGENNTNLPGRSTLLGWRQTWIESGMNAISLAPKYTGRVRKEQGWELRCLQMYHITSKPPITAVVGWLQQEGFTGVTRRKVETFIKSMPAEYGPKSKWRMGAHYHAQNLGPYISRDRTTVRPGEWIEGDGHKCDVYVQHPKAPGSVCRLEMTAWMDIGSRKIVGVYFSHDESAISTIYALSRALVDNDHVWDFAHIDNGAGYRAKLLSEESVGYYTKLGIEPRFAIPGNSKGKGDIEGWFGFYRNHHDKRYGRFYCGDDQSPDAGRKLTVEVANGKAKPPTAEETITSSLEFIAWYNDRPQPTLGNKSPNEMWGTRTPNPLHIPELATVRPSVKRMARRWQVEFKNRIYFDKALASFQDKYVEVEYDERNDSRVWIYDDKHRLICIADLKTRRPWVDTTSIRDDRLAKREADRVKRLQKKIDLVRAQEALIYDHTDTLDALEHFDATADRDDINTDSLPDTSDIDLEIDLLDDDYLDD